MVKLPLKPAAQHHNAFCKDVHPPILWVISAV